MRVSTRIYKLFLKIKKLHNNDRRKHNCNKKDIICFNIDIWSVTTALKVYKSYFLPMFY